MLNDAFIESLRVKLEAHPIYAAVQTLDDLRVFMQHHVYSVWDFMSLIKYLQHEVAPARWPWTPHGDASVQRFINELVLEEETDIALPGQEGPYQPLHAVSRRHARNRRRCRHAGAIRAAGGGAGDRRRARVGSWHLRRRQRLPAPPSIFLPAASRTPSPPRWHWGASTSSRRCSAPSCRAWR
jgi:hypothetical protein